VKVMISTPSCITSRYFSLNQVRNYNFFSKLKGFAGSVAFFVHLADFFVTGLVSLLAILLSGGGFLVARGLAIIVLARH